MLLASLLCVALTFDDGPTEYTRQVLEILAEYEAKATFFMTGEQVRALPSLAQAVVLAGHEVGNHAWYHVRRVTDEQVDAAQAEIYRVTGEVAQYFRPPYGAFGFYTGEYEQTLWTITGFDWIDTDAQSIANRVLRKLHDRGVILLHDNLQVAVEALPAILEGAYQQGYEVTTLGECQ